MNDNLHDTLRELLRSGSDANPALNALLHDYVKYHVAFIAIGGLFLLAFALLATSCWRRFRRTPTSNKRSWSFERATYALLGTSSVILALMMAVIVAANASNVLDPRQGFSGAVDMIGTARAGTRSADVHQAFTTWLQSGRRDPPTLIDDRIHQRLAWQRPKAIIYSALLVVFVVLSDRLWRTLVKRSRGRHTAWKRKDRALLVAGVVAGPVCLALTFMAIRNAQATFSPLTMTLFFG